MINYNYFKNKRILVTGHTGFKGSWLVTWLNLLGSKVMGVSLDPAKGDNHFKVFKHEDESRTVTNIKLLNKSDRVDEIAEMLSGKKLNKSAKELANQLLN